jgi:hypothetical protein
MADMDELFDEYAVLYPEFKRLEEANGRKSSDELKPYFQCSVVKS